MAGFRSLRGNWKPDGHCYFAHSYVVYLHLLPHIRLACYYLHDYCLLDEYETVYSCSPEKSGQVPISQD
jgi:imidazoleglycerol phosphate synthase glutamine amidotransferase subunit HisH